MVVADDGSHKPAALIEEFSVSTCSHFAESIGYRILNEVVGEIIAVSDLTYFE